MNYSKVEISHALQINRSTLYYKARSPKDSTHLTEALEEAFKKGKQTYGTRRIQVELRNEGHKVSRRKISEIMKKSCLVSVYAKSKYKRIASNVNETETPNIIARKFDGYYPGEVIVSDLTYFKIGNKWHYLCPLLDLCGRYLIGYSVGKNKTTDLIQRAFYSVKGDLRKIKILHTDRGSEFKSKVLSNLLAGFSISHSLSGKGNPIDNAVIESFNKTIKMDFIYRHKFVSIQDFIKKMDEHKEWYNNVRLHSSLGYLPPVKWMENMQLLINNAEPDTKHYSVL